MYLYTCMSAAPSLLWPRPSGKVQPTERAPPIIWTLGAWSISGVARNEGPFAGQFSNKANSHRTNHQRPARPSQTHLQAVARNRSCAFLCLQIVFLPSVNVLQARLTCILQGVMGAPPAVELAPAHSPRAAAGWHSRPYPGNACMYLCTHVYTHIYVYMHMWFDAYAYT